MYSSKISVCFSLSILFLFLSSCTSDDNTKDDESNQRYIQFTYEGGDNDDEPTEVRIDDEYIHEGDYYTSHGVLKDTLLLKTLYIEKFIFNGTERSKYDIFLEFVYIQSENKIINAWSYFNSFYHPKYADSNILVSTTYHALSSTGYPLEISNVEIDEKYVTGNFEGIMYSDPAGPITSDVRKMKITNGKFKIKLEE